MRRIKILMTAAIILAVAACKKEGELYYNGETIPFELSMFYGGENPVWVVVDDTSKVWSRVGNKQFYYTPGSGIQIPDGHYLFSGTQQTAPLRVIDTVTKKILYEATIKRDTAGKANVFKDLFYFGGKMRKKPVVPTAEEGYSNYVFAFFPAVTGYKEPVDLVYGFNYWDENFQNFFYPIQRISSIKPGEFSPLVKLPESTSNMEIEGEQRDGYPVIKIFKAGTDLPYITGTRFTIGEYAEITLSQPGLLGIKEVSNSPKKTSVDQFENAFYGQ